MNPTRARDVEFIARLKAAGERITSPRLAIFRLLGQYSPLPMGKLTQKAKNDGVDTVTVYRAVSLFKKLGLIQEVGVGNRRLLELTDDFGGHHHHFWCSSCGKIIDFDDNSLEQAMQQAATSMGIDIESHQLEIVGRCQSCQTATKTAQAKA